jgi:hypothetical protein
MGFRRSSHAQLRRCRAPNSLAPAGRGLFGDKVKSALGTVVYTALMRFAVYAYRGGFAAHGIELDAAALHRPPVGGRTPLGHGSRQRAALARILGRSSKGRCPMRATWRRRAPDRSRRYC